MRFEQQLRTFLTILSQWPGNIPLAKFLQVYFRQNKQMGSTDRRVAGMLLYTYFRLGNACADLPPEERLFIALFLCNTEDNAFLNHFKPELNSQISLSLDAKVPLLGDLGGGGGGGFKLEDVFPFHTHLSAGIDKQAFLRSFFIQPDLFIRLNPGKEEFVKIKLEEEGIPYKEEGEAALRLPNGTKLDMLFPDNSLSLFEIQDLSSQQTGEFYKPEKQDYWWDACAGSGGKSLLLVRQQPDIKLMVSDMRETILSNLDERFLKAGLLKYQKKELDLTQNPDPVIHDYKFDGIILDTSCTGSGTWGRTPEMISQFNESTIKVFQKLQQSIIPNVVKYLKPGKPLIYITCSVFKEENELMVDWMVKEFGLRVESSKVLKGYETRADTMFIARLANS